MVDTVLAVGLMAVSGGVDSPLLFFSLFPIITAALRFSFLTSLAVALFIAIGYLSLGFLEPTSLTVDVLLAKIGNVVIILLAAVVTALIGGQMKRRVALSVSRKKRMNCAGCAPVISSPASSLNWPVPSARR